MSRIKTPGTGAMCRSEKVCIATSLQKRGREGLAGEGLGSSKLALLGLDGADRVVRVSRKGRGVETKKHEPILREVSSGEA